MEGTESTIPDKLKTPMMKWFELKFDKPIEELLVGSLAEVAHRLDTNKSTISKWKKRLDLDQAYALEHKTNTCEYCGGTVADLNTHLETCAWAEEARLEELYGAQE